MFDDCLGRPVMQKIHASQVGADSLIALVADKYRCGIADELWIPQLAVEGGWVVITSDKARQSGVKTKLPALCLEYGVTHILVAQSIGMMKTEEKATAILFVWEKILLASSAAPGTRYSMKLATSRSQLSRGIRIDRVEPQKKGNNIIQTL
jgi:hypothetical protein